MNICCDLACEYSCLSSLPAARGSWERASVIYYEKFHTDDVNHPSLISYNYNNMHMKPNKN